MTQTTPTRFPAAWWIARRDQHLRDARWWDARRRLIPEVAPAATTKLRARVALARRANWAALRARRTAGRAGDARDGRERVA